MPEVLIEEKSIINPIKGDFLNRQEFIHQVKEVIELLSSNKKNSCFAISGSWGIGKSYVLDKLEKQLLFEQDETTTLDKYFVFHFNCWEYDYYEEPLIAIVSSMIDEINAKERLFSETVREHIFSAAKFIFSKLYEGGSAWLESKIGVNPSKITKGIFKIHSDAKKKIDAAHEYDKNLDFKKALTTLRKEIELIASERTVIFVVDELDRCIPEYQIKVLERLHHIFYGIENMQVVLAVDKGQLKRTVEKMFGENVDTQKYLAKFIKFEIELGEGSYSNQFEDMLGFYFNQFEGGDDPDVSEFKQNVFSGIEIRERIGIVEKCHLLHNLLNTDGEKSPAIFMCIELFLTIVKHTNACLPRKAHGVVFSAMFGDSPSTGLHFLQEKMSREVDNGYNNEKRRAYCYSDGYKSYIDPSDLWGILLGCYAIVTETAINGFVNGNNLMNYVKNYSINFWTLLETIK